MGKVEMFDNSHKINHLDKNLKKCVFNKMMPSVGVTVVLWMSTVALNLC